MLDGIATNGRSAEQRSHLEQARHDPMRWVGRDVVEPARNQRVRKADEDSRREI